MLILVSHPTGNANVRGTLSALSDAGILRAFHTAICHDPGAWWVKLLPGNLQKEFGRRSCPLSQGLVHTHGLREWTRLAADRMGFSTLTEHETGWASIDAVYREADRHVARSLKRYSDLTAVYAYEDGARDTFREARARGLRCYYDLPIGYWRFARRLLTEEAELQPEWAATLSGNRDSEEKLARKDEELALADKIFVASSFTRRTLEMAAIGNKPVQVIPYGAPICVDNSAVGMSKGGRLRVLFVGSLGQRKGLSYLLEAVRRLGSAVELTLIGRVPAERCEPLTSALQRHRHIDSLPHAVILEQMRCHDILVFPSLFEGFGLVLLEAMAQGLPVITTAHTAGPDLITDGTEGFVVPIRSAEAIAEKLELLDGDRARLRQMGTCALRRAREVSWDNYANQLVATLRADSVT
jgi:glycosyltransferase involved in cell wall biosynthesis